MYFFSINASHIFIWTIIAPGVIFLILVKFYFFLKLYFMSQLPGAMHHFNTNLSLLIESIYEPDGFVIDSIYYFALFAYQVT